MLKSDDIEKIRDFCTKYRKIAALYVFGSMATGRNRKKSDIDLAIIVRSHIESMERVDMETEFSNLLHRDVDLILFDQATPLMQHQILKNGHLLYEADPQERIRQEVCARRAYLDSAFLYRKLKQEQIHG